MRCLKLVGIIGFWSRRPSLLLSRSLGELGWLNIYPNVRPVIDLRNVSSFISLSVFDFIRLSRGSWIWLNLLSYFKTAFSYLILILDFGHILLLFLSKNSFDCCTSGLLLVMLNFGFPIEVSYLYSLFLTQGSLGTVWKFLGERSIFDTISDILSRWAYSFSSFSVRPSSMEDGIQFVW